MKKIANKLLSEPFVQKCVRKYLKKKGFGRMYERNTELREHGVDIKVKHKDCGWFYLVEVKGDPGSNVKSMGGSRNSSMNSALGQIITRMHTRRKGLYGGYNYGIAFPYSFKEMILNKIPYYVCNRLRLCIFLVNQNGTVEEYNHRKLKMIQS